MRQLLNMGLRARLLVVVLVALMPFVLLNLYDMVEQRRLLLQQATEAAQAHTYNLARLAANNDQQLISAARQLLEVLSYVPEIRSLDSAACHPLLAGILKSYPAYTNVAVLNGRGDVWCSAVPMTQAVNAADRAWFQGAIQARGFVLGGYQVEYITGLPSLVAAHAVVGDDGEVMGVLSTALKLDGLNQQATEAQLPKGSTFSLIDEQGTILARFPDPERWVGKTITQEPVFRTIVQKGGDGVILEQDLDGETRLFGLASLQMAPDRGQACLMVGIPYSAVIAEVNRASTCRLVGMILAISLALILAWVGSCVFWAPQLAAANQELEAIAKRKQAEEKALAALAKEKELGELRAHFISTISHEFRTPLSTILSSAQLLELHGQSFDQEKNTAFLQRIQAATRQMAKLLDDILTITRIEADKVGYRPAPLDLLVFCGDLVKEIQTADQTGHRIELNMHGANHQVRMDDKLLRQILQNLLSNALKYSPSGSVVSFDLAIENEGAIFRIQDHGIGIPEREQKRVGELFYRGSNAIGLPGSGLGMAIIRRSVALHNGTLVMESKTGVGTTVTVKLPTEL